MKRILATVILLLLAGVAVAQKPANSRNVLGSPVYYDTLGNVRGETPQNGTARLPKHHYLNRLSNDYCSLFLEMDGWFGGDIALGGSFTWLPERWGFYGKGLAGAKSNYFAAGPALRLSGYGGGLDWQLYGGVVISSRLGGELGLRMALPKRSGSFCWESLSLGVAQVGRRTFFTCGMSLELVAATASAAILWW